MSKKTPVTVKPLTPRLRIKFRKILRKVYQWDDELASELDIPIGEVDEMASDYAMLSVRVSGVNGDVGFEFASPEDTPKALKDKFLVYMNLEDMSELRKLEDQIFEMDRPANPDTAPSAVGLDPEV
jgi:hypothetical protein